LGYTLAEIEALEGEGAVATAMKHTKKDGTA